MTVDQPQRVFVVSLVPQRSDSDPIHALRALLKIALRRFKLRCIEVREEVKA